LLVYLALEFCSQFLSGFPISQHQGMAGVLVTLSGVGAWAGVGEGHCSSTRLTPADVLNVYLNVVLTNKILSSGNQKQPSGLR
jgi:hypothetical protein